MSLELLFLIIIFLFIGIISCVVNSQYKMSALIFSSFLAVKFWLIIFAMLNIKADDKINRALFRCVKTIEIIAIILGVINFLFPTFYLRIFTPTEIPYRFGFLSIFACFNHPGTFGWFMILCSFIHFIDYETDQKKKNIVLCFITIILAFLSLRTKVILSFTFCYSFYFIVIKKNNVKTFLNKLLYVLILVVFIFAVFSKQIINTYKLYYTKTTEYGMSAREALRENSFKIMKDYFPIGVGFGKYGTWYASVNYSEYYYKYKMSNIYGLRNKNSKYSMDTFWPTIIGETGMIGLVLYVAMIILCYRKLMKERKINNNNINSLAVLVFIQTIVESFGFASFNSSPQNVLSAIIIGFAISYNMRRKKRK